LVNAGSITHTSGGTKIEPPDDKFIYNSEALPKMGFKMDKYYIKDSSKRDHFTQIPNLVAMLDLEPFTFRIYFHIKMVTGENGSCWQSADTISSATGISVRKISDCKKELVDKGLILVENMVGNTGNYQLITIVDIWQKNAIFFNELTGGHALTAGGVMQNLHTNKIEVNNINNSGRVSTDTNNDASITENETATEVRSPAYAKPKPEKKLSKKQYDEAGEQVKAMYQHAKMARGNEHTLLPEQYMQQASWFQQYTGLTYLPKFQNLWISGFEEWSQLGATEEDVMKAVTKLQSNGMSIISPGSLTKTLNGVIANRKSDKGGYNPWK
jgi:biotin operon repressor